MNYKPPLFVDWFIPLERGNEKRSETTHNCEECGYPCSQVIFCMTIDCRKYVSVVIY